MNGITTGLFVFLNPFKINLVRKTIPYTRFLFMRMSLIALLLSATSAYAQFYRGSHNTFGKNRIQFEERRWLHMDFDQFNVYYYDTGEDHAEYASKSALKNLKSLERFYDYRMQGKIYILVFNNIEDFRQSNIGLEDGGDQNIGGKIKIHGNKLFVYFEGDHSLMDKQIRKGLSEILFFQMGYGENWKEIIKNSALLTIPDWYKDGIISYSTEAWSSETDDRIRDAVLGGRFKKFNKLEGDDATYLGHALWHYIAKIYGDAVIPNIVYMSRVSRNVENGFLYVLGVGLETLVSDARNYYRSLYESEDKIRSLPEEQALKFRTRKTRKYGEIALSSSGKTAAFTTDEFTQKRIFLYDIEKEKYKKIKRIGHKLDRVTDNTYPILAWHPNGEILAAVYEKRGEVFLHLYDVKTKKWEKRLFRNIEQVKGISFSPDGKTLAVSAVRNGQVDLFAYKMMTNSLIQETNDIYDDLAPTFVPGSEDWLFLSNRPNDTLTKDKGELDQIQPHFDVFRYGYGSKSDVLTRLTNTPNISEREPYGLPNGRFLFLSDESGIVNRYIGQRDSTISRIDTVIHYRYFTSYEPVTNYKRNILEHYPNPESKELLDLVYYDHKYRLYKTPLSAAYEVTEARPVEVTETELSKTFKEELKQTIPVENLRVEPMEEPEKPQGYIDINNYRFNTEKPTKEESEPTKRKPIENSKFITLKVPGKEEKKDEFALPLKENYRPAFIAQDIVTQLDWNFANSLYQRFNGGPYVNPGMGLVVKTGVVDLLEDYKFEGGMRYSVDGDNTEFFATFHNRKMRLDKEFTYQILNQKQQPNDFNINKNIIQKGSFVLKYPFSAVSALRGTASLRQDRTVTASINDISLREPDEVSYLGGAKLEFIFDNTRPLGLNLMAGTRYKIWSEAYQEFNVGESDFFVFGLDYRKYIKIHRNLIWANRFSYSTSLGNRKLVYYMGAVDDWLVFGGDQFDFDQNIDRTQGYYFQTIATPMRGFIQNVRNGNSFALFNSELRWPIFSYFSQKPIKSDFIKNFQVIGFTDIGSAWTGPNPYSEENSFNTRVVTSGGASTIVRLENKKDPVVGSYGFGLRSKLLGYFVRFDYAWGVEDGIIQDPIYHFSLALDF